MPCVVAQLEGNDALDGQVILAGTQTGLLLGCRGNVDSECTTASTVTTVASLSSLPLSLADANDKTGGGGDDGVYVMRSLPLHQGPVMDVCTSTTHLIATAGQDAVCCLVDLAAMVRPAAAFAVTDNAATLASVRRLRKHTMPVVAVRFFSDGVTLASLAADGRLLLTDVTHGEGSLTTLHDIACGFAATTLALSLDETCCFVGGRLLVCVDLLHTSRAQSAYDAVTPMCDKVAKSAADAADGAIARQSTGGVTCSAVDVALPLCCDCPSLYLPPHNDRNGDTDNTVVSVRSVATPYSGMTATKPACVCVYELCSPTNEVDTHCHSCCVWPGNVFVHYLLVDAQSGEVHAVLARANNTQHGNDNTHRPRRQPHAHTCCRAAQVAMYAVATWPYVTTSATPVRPRCCVVLDQHVSHDANSAEASHTRANTKRTDVDADYATWACALVAQLQRQHEQQALLTLPRTLRKLCALDIPWSVVLEAMTGHTVATLPRHAVRGVATAAPVTCDNNKHPVAAVTAPSPLADDVAATTCNAVLLAAEERRHADLRRQCDERMQLLKKLIAQRAATQRVRDVGESKHKRQRST